MLFLVKVCVVGVSVVVSMVLSRVLWFIMMVFFEMIWVVCYFVVV